MLAVSVFGICRPFVINGMERDLSLLVFTVPDKDVVDVRLNKNQRKLFKIYKQFIF